MTTKRETRAVPESKDADTAALEARIAELERRLEAFEATGGGRSDVAGLGSLAGAGDVAASRARAAGRGAQEAVSSLTRNMLPDDARRHLRAATREQLMALRIYLDRWIASLEKDEEPAPRRHETIEIEE
jgi:hypothetical protein